jgi:hypothetical protein
MSINKKIKKLKKELKLLKIGVPEFYMSCRDVASEPRVYDKEGIKKVKLKIKYLKKIRKLKMKLKKARNSK